MDVKNGIYLLLCCSATGFVSGVQNVIDNVDGSLMKDMKASQDLMIKQWEELRSENSQLRKRVESLEDLASNSLSKQGPIFANLISASQPTVAMPAMAPTQPLFPTIPAMALPAGPAVAMSPMQASQLSLSSAEWLVQDPKVKQFMDHALSSPVIQQKMLELASQPNLINMIVGSPEVASVMSNLRTNPNYLNNFLQQGMVTTDKLTAGSAAPPPPFQPLTMPTSASPAAPAQQVLASEKKEGEVMPTQGEVAQALPAAPVATATDKGEAKKEEVGEAKEPRVTGDDNKDKDTDIKDKDIKDKDKGMEVKDQDKDSSKSGWDKVAQNIASINAKPQPIANATAPK